MDKTLGWLHLSDLHFLDKHDWRDSPVLKKLRDDVAHLKTNGLCIDLVLCTGDIGYGEASTDPLTAQYADAKVYFDNVLHACGLTNDRVFLVPGNHDIDRTKVLTSQTLYFRSAERDPQDINQMFRDRHGEVQGAMERLDQYRHFLQDHYPHIRLDGNATFGAWLTVNDVKISIAGLNSAWTCADNEDKGNLWLAGEAQLHACRKAIEAASAGSAADIRIALMHHPLDWLIPAEAKQLRGLVQNACDFLLHGHEHDQWVREHRTPYHIVIASGAATAATEGEFGYNLVQLGPGKANIHLRSYHKKGSGWGKEIIPRRADDGIWPVTPPPVFSSLDQPVPPLPAPAPQRADDSPTSRGHFGLNDILARCSNQLTKDPLLALYGMAGVGKTVIVEELQRLPEWRDLRRVTVIVEEDTGLNDFFGQLAPYLSLHDERPRPPIGRNGADVADSLRRIAPDAAPFFLHIQRGQRLLANGKWRYPDIAHLLDGLVSAYPRSAIVLESREQPHTLTLKSLEACGLPKTALTEYLAHPPGLDSAGWDLRRDTRSFIFQRLGGGHGRGFHAYGLFLLVQLAAAKNVSPDKILRQYAKDYAEALYEKLFRDLFQNVLQGDERHLLFACSLYRNGLHYSHLSRLEDALSEHKTGDTLVRRRLLTEDAEWLYVHDLAAEQAGKLMQDDAQTRALHHLIAGFWLTDLHGQRHLIEANIRRALEAFYHLEQAGEGERVSEIAPELLGRRPDETVATLWRLQDRFFQARQSEKVHVILEYLLKITPDDHKAMRFLGQCRRKLYGKRDRRALSLFREATRLNSTFPPYWADYGTSAIACGHEAIETYLHEVKSAPPDAIDDHVAAVHASALEAAGRGNDASKLREEKIDAGSRDSAFYADQAQWLLNSRQDAEGALTVLEKARHRHCANEFTEAIYTKALEAVGRGDEASQLRQEKIDAGSRNPVFYANQAQWLLNSRQDVEGALAVLEKARQRGCANEFTDAIYAKGLEADGRGDEASQLRQEKIDAGSHEPICYNDQAQWLLNSRQDAEGALAVLEKARQRRCADAFTDAIYTKALEAVGRGDEASQLRQEKIDAGSRDPVFYNDQAQWLLNSRQDAEGALAVLEKVRQRGCADEFTDAIYAKALKAVGRGDEASKRRQEKVDAGSRDPAL